MRYTVKDSRRSWLKSSSWVFALLIAVCSWAGSGRLLADDGKKSTDNAKKAQPPELVGCRLAPGMIALLEDEVKEGLKRRGIESRFAQFASYAATTLNNTADGRGWSELLGNGRLSWYDKLYRNPSKATAEAEQFTRKLHQAVLASRPGLGRVLDMAAEKLDWKIPKAQPPVPVASSEEALNAVKQAVTESRTAYLAALAILTPAERGELQQGLYPILTEQNQVGHTLSDRPGGRRLLDLLEKTDRSSMYSAARALR